MAKPKNMIKPLDGSSSNSAFTMALSLVRSKKSGDQQKTNGAKGLQSKERSAKKFRKAWQNKIYSRCSPSLIVDLIEDLDNHKLELVNQMGFQGLISLKLSKLNRQFGAWLLSKFDPQTGVLCVGTRLELTMTCNDIKSVMGIPSTGKKILPASKKETTDLKAYLCFIFGKSSWDDLTIPFLERLLTSRSEGPMDADEAMKFKMAFVIYIVTKFLAPQSYNNYISTRYLKAVVDIENVHNYNWADFVAEELKNSAAVLQSKIKNRESPGYINGCIILLQIFYIDNLDFGKDNLAHNILPRIGAYDDNKLAEFVERDIILKNRSPFPTYGKLKLRDHNKVCYGRCTYAANYQLRDHNNVRYGRSMNSPNNKVVPRTHVDNDIPSFDLGITQTPSEYIAPVCTPTKHVASNLIQDFNIVSPSEQILATLDDNHLDNNHSDPPVPSEDDYLNYVVPNTPESEQGLQSSSNLLSPASFISPHSAMREVSAIRIVLREEYSCTKYPPKSKRRIIGEPSDLLMDRPRRTIKPSNIVKSPFLCKQQSFMRYDLKAVDDLYVFTVSQSDEASLTKIWVHISNPVPLTLNMHQIQQALRFDVEMDDETFNVAVQAIFEDELQRFGGTDFVGWRHFLNQDFSMFASAGSDMWNPEDHLHCFNDDTLIPYDVCNCRLIFVPVHHPHHYALYAFDMHRKKLCILDPLRDTTISPKALDKRHSKIKVVISTALAQCMKLSYPKWDEDIPNWPVDFPTNINIHENKLDCSLHVLNYMRSWDGTRLVMPSCKDSVELRKQFLANLLSFKKNEAILPDYVNRCLKAWDRK